MAIYDFGLRLKELRKAKKMSQADVADRIGISRVTMSGYEANTITPSVEKLAELAAIYNTSVDYLLGIDNRPLVYLDGLTDSQQDTVRSIVERLKEEFHKIK